VTDYVCSRAFETCEFENFALSVCLSVAHPFIENVCYDRVLYIFNLRHCSSVDINGVLVGYAECYSKGPWSFSEGLALD
jgi:hypothetical protein